jgi:hypothetical protein
MSKKQKGFGANANQLARLMYGKYYINLDYLQQKNVRIKKKILG